MIELGDVQTSLTLFAEAIKGDPLALQASDSVDPRQHGSSQDNMGPNTTSWPWAPPSDSVLVLPLSLESRGAYRTRVLHHVVKSRVAVPVEILDAGPSLVADLFSMIEDHRVAAALERSFPGATSDLHAVLRNAGEALTGADRMEEPVVAAVRRHVLGLDPSPAAGLSNEVLEAVAASVDGVRTPQATAEDSLAAAEWICELAGILRNTGVGISIEEMDISDAPSVPTEESTGVSLDGGTPTEVRDGPAGGGGQTLSDSDHDATAAAADESEEPVVGSGLKITGLKPTVEPDRRIFLYDEWDCHENRYRSAWCRVIEEQLTGDAREVIGQDFIGDVRHRHQGLRAQIRQQLKNMRPQELVRVHRSDDGDELDLDAVIEAIADLRGGAPVDERLHIRRDRAARDVATAFLVDLSASTSSPAVPPEPAPIVETDPMDDPLSYGPIWDAPPVSERPRRVIDVAKDAVALMGEALHELGDRYAIYGFSGSGRMQVDFKIGKDFDDRVSSRTWAAVGTMKPLRYTRMGPAVRHATAKLSREAAKTRLLIVVSDGYPQDEDYGIDRSDREYGLQDTARALADAQGLGIETYCLTIDPAGHDYLRDMCPEDRYAVIEDVESLPQELAALYLQRLGQ